METKKEKAREEILKYSKKLYNKNLVAGTSGNISCRIDDSVFITPSGISYEEMTVEDIVEIDFLGNVINNSLNRKPSSEWQMHIEVYKKYDKYNAIVHTHSPYATAFATVRENIPIILIEMKPFIGGEILVAPYKQAGSKELGEAILPYLEKTNSCLLANHGTISCGEFLESAFLSAEYVEDIAKIYYYAKNIGEPKILE